MNKPSLSIAYATKRAARKKMSNGGKVEEQADQNFLSDEDETSEMSDKASQMLDNPHESPDDEADKSGGLLSIIMKRLRKKHMGV